MNVCGDIASTADLVTDYHGSRNQFTEISFSKVSNTSVRINWNTDRATTGLIEYGTNSVGELSKMETHPGDPAQDRPGGAHSFDGLSLSHYCHRCEQQSGSHRYVKFKTTKEPGKSATPSSDATFISQVIESSDFRTNLGVNNLSTSTANVSVTLVDVDGMELATKTMQVEPQGLTQLNAVAPYLYEENLGNEIRGSLYLESDQPISAWASQIENSTNDPSLLLSKRSWGDADTDPFSRQYRHLHVFSGADECGSEHGQRGH